MVLAIPPFGLRMLPELRQQVEEVAQQNGRSMNAEIVARLEIIFQSEYKTVSFDTKQTTEMSMLTMLNFIELILDSDKTGNTLKGISQTVRAQFRKDYPDRPLLSKLTDIDAMRSRAQGSSANSKNPKLVCGRASASRK